MQLIINQQPFDFPNLQYVATVDQSMALNKRNDPLMVIAGRPRERRYSAKLSRNALAAA